MNAAEIERQIAIIIAAFDARLRRGLISPEEHLITVGEVMRWAAAAKAKASTDPDEE